MSCIQFSLNDEFRIDNIVITCLHNEYRCCLGIITVIAFQHRDAKNYFSYFVHIRIGVTLKHIPFTA